MNLLKIVAFVLAFCYEFGFSESRRKSRQTVSKYPIILLPGYMGTQLKYSVNYSNQNAMLCRLVASGMNAVVGEKTLWLNIMNFFPPYDQCWQKFAKLRYNKNEKKSYPFLDGVNIRAPDFGSTKYMEYLAPFPQQISLTNYLATLVSHLVDVGYENGVNVKGAPYDWRKSPHEQNEFFASLQTLVETTYNENGGKKVILMGHSMGGNFAYIFLNSQSLQWKQKYIRALFTIATPFGGTFKYLYDYLKHDDYPADMFPLVRSAERTYSAMSFLLPKPLVFKNSILISTPEFNYTSEDYERFFNKIKHSFAYQMFLDANENYKELRHPGVDVVCIGGLGYRTLRGLVYSENNFSSTPKVIYGNGDQFVNQESLKACKVWKNTNGYTFKFTAIRADHLLVLKSKRALEVITDSIKQLN